MTTPALRVPATEWAWQEASGRLVGLSWVDHTPRVHAEAWTVRGRGADAQFRGEAVEPYFPSPLVEAAADAHARGEPTAVEAVSLALARIGWRVQTRDRWWEATSPVPALLAPLVEAFGVDAEAHRHDPDRLANLRARVPGWYPARGSAAAALSMLEGALDAYVGVVLAPIGEHDEAFACRDASWWSRRGVPSDTLRIGQDGLVRIPAGAAPPALPEDVPLLVDVHVGGSPRALFRLLPAWASVRLQLPVDA